MTARLSHQPSGQYRAYARGWLPSEPGSMTTAMGAAKQMRRRGADAYVGRASDGAPIACCGCGQTYEEQATEVAALDSLSGVAYQEAAQDLDERHRAHGVQP